MNALEKPQSQGPLAVPHPPPVYYHSALSNAPQFQQHPLWGPQAAVRGPIAQYQIWSWIRTILYSNVSPHLEQFSPTLVSPLLHMQNL